MKKITLVLFLAFLIPKFYAQNLDKIPVLFETSPSTEIRFDNTEAKQVFNRIKSNPINQKIWRIKFNNLAKSSSEKSDGYFKFSFPITIDGKRSDEILAIPIEIKTEDADNYTYTADLFYGKNGKGNLVLIHKDGENYGSMKIGNRYFRIESFGKGDEVLIEIRNDKEYSQNACGTSDTKKPQKEQILGDLSDYSKTCTRNVRILVLFTNRANAISNPTQLASTLIAETNTALYKSKIYSSNLHFQLAGVQSFSSFVESNSAQNDLNRVVTSSSIATLRNNAGADLVVLLTDGNYRIGFGFILGIATLDNYGNPNTGFAAIVEADSGNFTFGHEVGHILGARHDTDTRTNIPNLSNTAHGHSWFYRNWFLGKKHYQKSMVASGTTKGSRVLHYSNPAVKAHKKARDKTGTSTRNNYVQLKNAACPVSDYNSFEEMRVSIVGPWTVAPFTPFTLNASVSNCSNYSYHWMASTNGFTYYNAGTSSSYTGTIYGSDETRYVKLTVTCSDGQIKTAYKTVHTFGHPEPIKSLTPNEISIDSGDKNRLEEIITVYPNPVSTTLNLSSNFSTSKKIKVYLYDILRNKKIPFVYNRRIVKGDTKTLLDVSKMNQGIYQLIIKDGDVVLYNKKIVISRR